MENSEILKSARESLSGNWVLAIITIVVYTLIVSGIGSIPVAGGMIVFIIGGPFLYGRCLFAMSLARGENARLEQIFDGFKQFERSVIAYLLIIFYVIIYLLLLIIPGIIKALAFQLTFYIMIDDSEISATDALKKSEKMMNGYKMKYFSMLLWFLLLGILCIFTLGIGYLWLFPYMYVSYVKFYEDVKANYVEILDDSNQGKSYTN